MKICEIDIGDHHLSNSFTQSQQQKIDVRKNHLEGHWLIDPSSGKKLSGPFKDKEAALRFKENRKDKIPANAEAKKF